MDEEVLQSQVDLIREVFMYAHRFRGKRFVFQIGSHLIEDPLFPSLIRDLAILHKSGIGLILVPGAGKRIDDVLSKFGVKTKRVKGIRVSSPEAMPLIKMAAFDAANVLMTQLSSQQVDSVIGNWVRARAIGVREGVDFEDAGTIARINIRLLEEVLADGLVPILPCIGWSGSGTPYNVSSLELASLLAEQMEADKLFFISSMLEVREKDYTLPTEGVIVKDGRVTRFNAVAAEKFVEANPQASDQLVMELLRLAAKAATSGVDRVHLMNGSIDGAILKEIFSTLGQGTMIHADPFDSIRPMRSADVAEVLRIMEPNIQKGILIKRDEDDLLDVYKDFVVYETDETIRGCGALHRYGIDSAEVAGLAVDANFAHLGLGQKIVQYLIDRARNMGLKRVFLLTTATGDFFESLGFYKAELTDLPPEKRQKYNEKRNSRIYVKNLPQ